MTPPAIGANRSRRRARDRRPIDQRRLYVFGADRRLRPDWPKTLGPARPAWASPATSSRCRDPRGAAAHAARGVRPAAGVRRAPRAAARRRASSPGRGARAAGRLRSLRLARPDRRQHRVRVGRHRPAQPRLTAAAGPADSDRAWDPAARPAPAAPVRLPGAADGTPFHHAPGDRPRLRRPPARHLSCRPARRTSHRSTPRAP
jgi:hypothetical protein